MACTHKANAGVACTAAVLSIVLNNGGMASQAQGMVESANATRHLMKDGNRQLQAGKFEDAILAYSLAIQTNPNWVEAYYLRGFAHFYQGTDQAAIADFTQAIRLQPNLAKAYSYRGLIFYQQQRMGAAIADFTQAIEHDSNLTEAYYFRELIHRELWRSNDVYGSSRHLLTAALTHWAAGHPWEPRSQPEAMPTPNAMSDSPECHQADAFYSRGLVMLRRGDRQAAIEKLQTAASLYQQEHQQAQYQRTEKLLGFLEGH